MDIRLLHHDLKSCRLHAWPTAQAQCMQAEARMQAEVSHRGHYVARVDATELMDPYDRSMASAPEIVSIVMQDNVHLPVSSDTSATIGCA